MKIAVIVYSLDGIGGIAKHVLYLCNEFFSLGHHVNIWSVEYNKECCYPELTKNFEVKTLRPTQPYIREVKKPPGLRSLAYMLELWNYYQEERRLCSAIPGGYDVINAHGGFGINWAAAAYKHKYSTPAVWLCNDFWPIPSFSYGVPSSTLEKIKNLARKPFFSPFYQYDQAAVRNIDKIAVLSEHVKSQMKEHYGENPIVVRPGVDSARFRSGNGLRIRNRYEINESSFLLLTVSMPMPRRRLEDVIRAVRILSDGGYNVTYLIVGRTSFDPAYMKYLETEISECKLGKRVIFSSEVSEDDLADCYNACDAFVWASDENQSWGMAGMEAMAAAKPIIVSKANGLAEVLEERTALLVEPRSPKAIADATKRLMGEPTLANRLANAGQNFVNERYSWRRHAEEMLDLFREAMYTRDFKTSSV